MYNAGWFLATFVRVEKKCVLWVGKYRILYEPDTLLAEHLMLYIAAVGNAWLVLGLHWHIEAVLYLFWTQSLCRGTCIVSVAMDIYETDGRHLVVHAHCFPSYRLASSPLHQQLASHVVTTRHILYVFLFCFIHWIHCLEFGVLVEW